MNKARFRLMQIPCIIILCLLLCSCAGSGGDLFGEENKFPDIADTVAGPEDQFSEAEPEGDDPASSDKTPDEGDGEPQRPDSENNGDDEQEVKPGDSGDETPETPEPPTPVEAQSVSVNEKSITVYIGDTVTLRATILPAETDNKTLVWSSSDERVASVDGYGKVSGLSVGAATVTVTTANGKTATASVTVLKKPVPVESITLLPLGIELFEGETAYAVAEVLPKDADDRSVTFVASDTSVITVNEKGLVTAVGEGSATVKAVASNGKTASIPVTVRSRRLEESRYEYYYGTLTSDREKTIYAVLRDAMASCLVEVTDATAVYAAAQEPELIERLFKYVLLDHPEFFHVNTEYSRHSVGGVTTHISLSYNLTSAEYEMALERLSISLESLFEEIKKVSSESERALIAYNYVKDRLVYDKSDLGRACHMYNAFISGKAVCEGYSKLFGYILKKAGITCLQATGDISDGGHQWTMAMLNGSWYHFDPTWDDPITVAERPEGVLDLNYFAVPDDIIYDTRTAHEREVLPEAYHLDENYFVKNRLVLVDLSAESISAVARRSDNMLGHIALLCSPAVYEKLVTDSSYLWMLVGNVADDVTNVSYVHNEHSQVIEIFYE